MSRNLKKYSLLVTSEHMHLSFYPAYRTLQKYLVFGPKEDK